MKKAAFILLLSFSSFVLAQKMVKNQIVEASCGMCQFKQKTDKGCVLSVKIDSKVYIVTGTGINDHGDAHGDDGFCNGIRKAKVSGEIKGSAFAASEFNLLPLQ